MPADPPRRRRLPYQVPLAIGAYAIALLIAAAALVAWLSGDDESENDNGSTVQRNAAAGKKASNQQSIKPPAGKESAEEAEKRISEVVASDDCAAINELNPVSRQEVLDTEARCEVLKRLDRLKVRGTEEYGDAGAVIDYKFGPRTVTAVLIRDQDGLFHIAFIDSFRGVPSVDTKLAKQFDDAADRAVKALADRDCKAFMDVVNRRFGPGSADEEQICTFVEQNPIANLFEALPEANVKRLGGNEGYGFYSLAGPGAHYTLVLAEQTDKRAPPKTPKLPKGAAQHSYVDSYVTNTR